MGVISETNHCMLGGNVRHCLHEQRVVRDWPQASHPQSEDRAVCMLRHFNRLCAIYRNWCMAHGLPLNMSADELVVAYGLHPYEREWLQRFIRAWDKMIGRSI